MYYDPSGHACDMPEEKAPEITVGEKPFISQYDIPTNDKGYTKSNCSLGQKVHGEYKIGDVDKVNRFKEYILPRGKRVDFIDLEKRLCMN